MTSAVLGLPSKIAREEAVALVSELRHLWSLQVGDPPGDLRDDLGKLKNWFDPIASGERLRRELGRAPDATTNVPDPLVYQLPGKKVLVTPEGRAALALIELACSSADPEAAVVYLDGPMLADVERTLVHTYRLWLRQRLDNVSSLLDHETSTLRPAAAGLLVTLLLNRNTAPERALPRPRDRAKRAALEEALRVPALAWSSKFTGRPASPEAFDLYRGWAIGELARRLGGALHLGFEDRGLFLDASHVDTAIDRVVSDLKRRPDRLRGRVPAAWTSLLGAYKEVRPQLVALGVAYDRAFFTKQLGDRILAAAA